MNQILHQRHRHGPRQLIHQAPHALRLLPPQRIILGSGSETIAQQHLERPQLASHLRIDVERTRILPEIESAPDALRPRVQTPVVPSSRPVRVSVPERGGLIHRINEGRVVHHRPDGIVDDARPLSSRLVAEFHRVVEGLRGAHPHVGDANRVGRQSGVVTARLSEFLVDDRVSVVVHLSIYELHFVSGLIVVVFFAAEVAAP
mmetsp:Transcript_6812/g.14768  ORF Transcript_6812/g.14768 Transcript_6812/m.14768 type:complete len:203 (-) Transcript_6812:274-882(-)